MIELHSNYTILKNEVFQNEA